MRQSLRHTTDKTTSLPLVCDRAELIQEVQAAGLALRVIMATGAVTKEKFNPYRSLQPASTTSTMRFTMPRTDGRVAGIAQGDEHTEQNHPRKPRRETCQGGADAPRQNAGGAPFARGAVAEPAKDGV